MDQAASLILIAAAAFLLPLIAGRLRLPAGCRGYRAAHGGRARVGVVRRWLWRGLTQAPLQAANQLPVTWTHAGTSAVCRIHVKPYSETLAHICDFR